MIEESFAMWESGYHKECPAKYDSQPTNHSAYHTNNDFGTKENPVIKHECVGNLIYCSRCTVK